MHQHVDSIDLAMMKAERNRRVRDVQQIFAPHEDVDVFCKSAGVGLCFFDVEVNREASHNSILDACGRESLVNPFRQLEELFQTLLVKCVDEEVHSCQPWASSPFRIARRSMPSAWHFLYK